MVSRLRVAAGAAAMLLIGTAGVGTAQAADPAFHCRASAVTISGLGAPDPVAPVSAGSDEGPCTTAGPVGAPTLPANPLVEAHVLADTTYDAAARTGTATGGLTSLRVVPTPALVSQLPTQQAIDALPNIEVPVPVALQLVLGTKLSVDIRDAVRALVPDPTGALLAADAVTATASVACVANAPQLAGSSTVAALRIGGTSVSLDGPVNQILTLVSAQHIPLSQLDLTKVRIFTGGAILGPVTDAVLGLAQGVVGPALAALPPIDLPASPLDVSLTPGAQTRVGDTLTQRALRAKVDLAGIHLLDATIGEARVSADAGVCAPPPEAVQRPAPPDQGGIDAVTATGSVADQILACSDRKLVLMDVLRQGSKIKLLGAANRDYAGRQVAIRLKATKKVVGRATVQEDGSFQTTASLPPARYRTRKSADLVRYTAEIGSERSLPLKLERRMIVSSLTSKDGRVTIAGRVVGPLTTPVTTIRLTRRVSCRQQALVATFKPRRDGRFSVTVDAPAGQVAAVYRMTTSVRANRHNAKRFPTFTLPRGVALDQR